MPGVEHRQHKRLNHRAENSHQPTRLREKNMRKCTSAKHAQRFLSACGPLSQHFQPGRHRLSAREYRAILQGRFQTGNEVTRGKLLGSLLNILNPWLLSPLFPLFNSAISFLCANKLTIPSRKRPSAHRRDGFQYRSMALRRFCRRAVVAPLSDGLTVVTRRRPGRCCDWRLTVYKGPHLRRELAPLHRPFSLHRELCAWASLPRSFVLLASWFVSRLPPGPTPLAIPSQTTPTPFLSSMLLWSPVFGSVSREPHPLGRSLALAPANTNHSRWSR